MKLCTEINNYQPNNNYAHYFSHIGKKNKDVTMTGSVLHTQIILIYGSQFQPKENFTSF